MKKKYVKPQIIIENFSLSTTIAGECELDTKLPTRAGGCGYPTRAGVVFTDDVGSQCTEYPQVPGVYNGFCYHIPTETKNLFNS